MPRARSRIRPVTLMLAFFFALYHSNLREQGSPSDTLAIKVLNFSLLRGEGFETSKLRWEMASAGVGEPWLAEDVGKAQPPPEDKLQRSNMDRPPFAILPFFPIYAAYHGLDLPVTLFSVNLLGKIFSVFYALAALWLLHGIALNLNASRSLALTATAIFGAGTSIWQYVAGGFWTTSGFVPFFAAGIYFATLPKLTPGRVLAAGLFWGYAIACRQQDAVLVAPFALALLLRYPKGWRPFVLSMFVLVLAALSTNLVSSGSALGPYSTSSPSMRFQLLNANAEKLEYFGSGWWKGLAGTLVSPSRGLFVFTPFLLFPLFWLAGRLGAAGKPLARQTRHLLAAAAAGIALQTLVIGGFKFWWSGWAWGPRFNTGSMPAFFVLFILLWPARWNRWSRALFALAVGWSVFVQGLGAYKYNLWTWNAEPINVDEAPARLWDVKDNPISRAWKDRYYPPNWKTFSLDY